VVAVERSAAAEARRARRSATDEASSLTAVRTYSAHIRAPAASTGVRCVRGRGEGSGATASGGAVYRKKHTKGERACVPRGCTAPDLCRGWEVWKDGEHSDDHRARLQWRNKRRRLGQRQREGQEDMWWRQDAGESLEVEAGQARAGGGGGDGGGGGGGRGGVQDFGFERATGPRGSGVGPAGTRCWRGSGSST
jgi:hypothetical protein